MLKSKLLSGVLLVGIMLTSNLAQAEELSSNKICDARANDAINSLKNELDQVQNEIDVNQVSNAVNVPSRFMDIKYKIAPGDNIAFSIYGEEEFSQPQILVRPDGYMTVEPFGEFYVSGLGIDEVQELLKSKFKKYFINPKISVKVVNLSTAKVYVYGAVHNPGLYEQERSFNNKAGDANSSEITVASVISNAGGINSNADLRHVKIRNNESGEEYEVNLMKLIKEGDASQDIYVHSGDSIFVPAVATEAPISDEEFLAVSSSSLAPVDFPVRVIGSVNRPGVYRLSPSNSSLSSAIASSEGYNLSANMKAIRVQRRTPDGKLATINVNPEQNDILLRPNDLVMVVDKRSSRIARSFGVLGDLFSPFTRLADSYNSWAEMFNPTRRFIKD